MDNKSMDLITTKQQQINFIDEKFSLGKSINHLNQMMIEVTKDEINPKTVNAACNCVQQLNNTIDIAIKAARFLSE